MNNEIDDILEDLRKIIAKNNDEKDNILLDVLDSLSLAISSITKANTDLSSKIDNKQTGINITSDLTNVETILKTSFDNLTKVNENIINNNNNIFTKLFSILDMISKNSSKEQLLAINETLSKLSFKQDFSEIIKVLNKKEEEWIFSVENNTEGKLSRIIAKRTK